MIRLKAELAQAEAAQPAAPAPVSSPPSSLRMPAFEENRDKMDAYLERFERYATGEKWAKDIWAIRLSALLKGRSLDIFSRLPEDQAIDYDRLKVALLQNYQMTEDGYRIRFRTCKPEKQETPTQFASRSKSYFENWVKLAKIPKEYDRLVDLLLREQFMASCSKECMVYLKERTCDSMDDLREHAEKYVEAHGLHRFANSPSKSFTASKPNGRYVAKQGPPVDATESGKHRPSVSYGNRSSASPLKCFNCGQIGHRSYNCREPKRTKSPASGMSLLEQNKTIVEVLKDQQKAMKEMTESFKSTGKSEANTCFLV